MRKSLLSLLVLFVYSLVAFAQGGTEITWSEHSVWSGVVEKAAQISYAQGDWSIQASKGDGSTNLTVNETSNDCRVYAKGVVMISNEAGIGKLVFHISAAGKKRWTTITPSEGVITEDFEHSTITWEANGADVKLLMLGVGEKATLGTDGTSKAGQFDFSSVTAYTAAELAVTEPDPEPEPVPGFVLYHAGYNGNPGYIAFNGTEVGAQGVLVTLPNIASYDKARFAWQLVETETEGQFKIKNVGTGLFLGLAGWNQRPTAVAEENAPIYTKADYNGYATFNCPSGNYASSGCSWLHLDQTNQLTGWYQSSSASWFTVQEASAIDELLAQLAKAAELDAAIAAAQDMKRNITGYTEYTDLITSADQFNSNAKETTPGEGTYEALLDGDPTTFFHSQWQSGWEEKMPHDLQVKLPRNELTELVVRYAARNNSGNYYNIPTAMDIYGGTVDAEGNVTWEETPFTSLTAEDGAYNNFDVEGIGGRSGRFTINTGETVYTAFKFAVTDTYYAGDSRKFFSYGEFQISSAREVAPSVTASETQVLALDYAVAQAEAAQLGVSDYDALIAGINTAMENIENGVEPEPIPEVQAALTAALADAQEAIALRGPGYPVAEGESYNALNEAIATAQALTYPLPADVDALTAAVRTYKCARDVEMPAVNHKYAFAIVYQGETKYYLQNAHTENVLRPYVAEEELGDTLIFKCVEENEGKFTFTNSDGKYLTITQPEKSYFSTVCTGVADEKGETTDVTFEKIYSSNANAVAPADETELFGLLSWYGVRAYNPSNVPQYGYFTVKHSENAFDGAAAPYYNVNFTSAIKLIDLGIDPTLLTSVTPATTDTLEALPEQVVFTFEKNVQEVTSVRLRHNGWGGMRGTELVGEEGLVVTNADTVTVNVPASLVQGVTQMSLTLMGTAVDGGALSDGENGEMVVVQYQYTPNPARYVFTEANPADSSTVEKLDSIIVTFQHPAEGLTGGFAKDVVLNVLDAESTVVTTAKIDFDKATNDGWNTNALITLAEPVTANGTYTITIPEGTVFDDQYNANFEDYGVADWGAIYNPEFTLTYTVEEAPFEEYPVNFDKDAYQNHAERILNSITLTAGSGEEQTATLDGTKKAYQDLTDQSFTIASGDQVTVQANYSGEWMHAYVYVDLNNDKQFSYNNGADQTGTELLGWTYIAGYNNEGVAKGQNVNPNTPMTFTVNAEPGEYRMRVKIDWDNQDPGGCILSNNHILNNGGHIVDVTLVVTAGTGINAATLDENAKVYTLDGRRVIVNGKLNRGFYIINGQKTFVK
ncbi:MAG: Ig-like domain-containing protein [Bacteroidales bacterium]|nr:Ig-like domain-containing protein [Bacteroidales bacterium]